MAARGRSPHLLRSRDGVPFPGNGTLSSYVAYAIACMLATSNAYFDARLPSPVWLSLHCIARSRHAQQMTESVAACMQDNVVLRVFRFWQGPIMHAVARR